MEQSVLANMSCIMLLLKLSFPSTHYNYDEDKNEYNVYNFFGTIQNEK